MSDKRNRSGRLVALVGTVALSMVHDVKAESARSAEIVDIGSPECATFALSINESNQVVGQACELGNPYDSFPFLWTESQGFQVLPLEPFTNGFASSVNADGLVIGAVVTLGPPVIAAMATWQGQAMKLTPIAHGTWLQPLQVNNTGEVVGAAQLDSYHFAPFHWDVASGLTLLETNGEEGSAYANNDSGEIVGEIGDYVPALWTLGSEPEIFILPGESTWELCDPNWWPPCELYVSWGYRPADINNESAVVGSMFFEPWLGEVGFLWTRESGLHAVGLGVDWWGTRLTAINDRGQFAGRVFLNTASVYLNGSLHMLQDMVDDPAWDFEFATDLNNQLQIVGWGTHNGEQRAFLVHITPGMWCPSDCEPMGGDGVVSVSDVIGVITHLGTNVVRFDIAPAPVEGPLGDGEVSLADVIETIADFGPCEVGR